MTVKVKADRDEYKEEVNGSVKRHGPGGGCTSWLAERLGQPEDLTCDVDPQDRGDQSSPGGLPTGWRNWHPGDGQCDDALQLTGTPVAGAPASAAATSVGRVTDGGRGSTHSGRRPADFCEYLPADTCDLERDCLYATKPTCRSVWLPA